MQKHNSISLNNIIKGLTIEIYPEKDSEYPTEVFDALENNEAKYQIQEGCFYQYKLNNSKLSLKNNDIIKSSPFNKSEGRISPNYYVGTLDITILEDDKKIGVFKLEVQSVKTTYRKDYRFMLESIATHTIDLLLQTNSPISQTLDVDYNSSSKTSYQNFCFVRSIIETEEFELAMQKIESFPVTQWTTDIEEKDVRSLKRINNRDVRNLINARNRLPLENHKLNSYGVNSIASKIPTSRNVESVDTPENRFVKYVLETFLSFCENIKTNSKVGSRLYDEASTISNKLDSYLQYQFFKDVSRPTTLKLNSPILQKKEGYRVVLKTWLMYDLSAKLIWEGGEDVYGAGSKNVAKLYEYWLFFKLIEAVNSAFGINSEEYKKLICATKDNLGLMLKEGKKIALKGTCVFKERELSIKLFYNKSFGCSSNSDLSKSGSWTLQMRPDYTLSIWPKEISENIAEKTEQIVHIHFDSKYKVANLDKKSDPKRDDLIKMHAYKDAIRRTAGAYVLYPGVDDKPVEYKGYHEILPGLGSFAIRPSEENSGVEYLIKFLKDVKNHFLNRASQRENISSKTYEIIKNDTPQSLHEPIPEYLNDKKLIPDETFVLVGYYNLSKSNFSQKDWIEKNKLYNFRMGTGNGSLVLDKETVTAQYLLLHTKGDESSSNIWRIVSNGPKVFSKKDLSKKGYANPSQDFYLVIEIEEIEKEEKSKFDNKEWDFRKLPNYQSKRASSHPYTSTLSELMKSVIN